MPGLGIITELSSRSCLMTTMADQRLFRVHTTINLSVTTDLVISTMLHVRPLTPIRVTTTTPTHRKAHCSS